MGSISAGYEGYEDRYYYGRRPTGATMPPFRNVYQQDDVNFQGKYLIQTGASRSGWQRGTRSGRNGEGLKQEGQTPGPGGVSMRLAGGGSRRDDNNVTRKQEYTSGRGMQ